MNTIRIGFQFALQQITVCTSNLTRMTVTNNLPLPVHWKYGCKCTTVPYGGKLTFNVSEATQIIVSSVS